MREIKRLGIVLVALMAMGAPATATATLAKLHLCTKEGNFATGPPLVPGQNVHVQTKEAVVATSRGNITCIAYKYPEVEGVVGADLTNDKGTDKIALERSVGNFAGEGQGGACHGAGTLGPNAYVKVYNPASTTHLGNLFLRSDGIATIRPPHTTEPIYVQLTVGEARAKCVFSLVALKGTVSSEPHTVYEPYEQVIQALVLSFSQKLKFNEALSDPSCPKAATFKIADARPTSWEGDFSERPIFETGLS